MLASESCQQHHIINSSPSSCQSHNGCVCLQLLRALHRPRQQALHMRFHTAAQSCAVLFCRDAGFQQQAWLQLCSAAHQHPEHLVYREYAETARDCVPILPQIPECVLLASTRSLAKGLTSWPGPGHMETEQGKVRRSWSVHGSCWRI